MIDFKDTPVGDIAYNAAVPQSIDLPTDYALFALRCRLAGRATISGGTTSGTPWTENPMTLIENARVHGVKKNGGAHEIIDLDPATLYELASILDEIALEKTAISSGAAAAYDFIADIDIPLHNKGNKMSNAVKALSLLPAWLFSDLKLQLKFRDGTSTANGGLISAGDRAIALTAYGSGAGVPSVKVLARQALNINKAELEKKASLMKIYSKQIDATVTNAKEKQSLNRGASYRALLFKGFTDIAERLTSDAILNNLMVKISGTAKHDWDWKQLKAEMKKQYGYVPVGYGLIDFCSQGDDKTMLNTRGYEGNGISLEAEMNITGAANQRVKIVSLEVYNPGEW